MSDETFDVAAFAAQATGTVGVADDADHSTPVPNALADDLDAYADHAQRQRDAQMAEDAGDPQDETEQEAPVATDKRTVPLGALHEERSRRQALEQQLVQQQQQLAQYQQWHQQQLALQQQAATPDFDEDPAGHVAAVKRQMAQQMQGMQQQINHQQMQAHVQSEASAIAPLAQQSEAAFAAEVGQENYAAAFEHVRQHVHQDFLQRFPGISPQDLATVETAAGIQFIKQCQAQGVDPARYVWEHAHQLGFTPGQRVPGAAQERRSAPTSLSDLPSAGRAPDQRGRLTAKDIATMPQDEFDQMFESMRRSSEQWPV
ncbi:hypothetical protein R6U79_12555 [Pseudomonas putida]|uniref:hypothetical protein n=1 Tax=Pseudomonas putida TaxID=303 RepID=UPI0029DE81FF|nr:hypothetical protein [Pseudomonas putida]WPK03035.1 hypothetical protein R6U79_12555 [Pseudomonas putida]